MPEAKTNLSESLKRLREINEWFDAQAEADVEEWLLKIKEGVSLVKFSRVRLKEIENEFIEIKKELDNP